MIAEQSMGWAVFYFVYSCALDYRILVVDLEFICYNFTDLMVIMTEISYVDFHHRIC